MKWGDLNHTHDRRKVAVSAKSTPKHPVLGEGPYIGIVHVVSENAVPILQVDDYHHAFAWWYDVEFVD